MIRKFRAGCAAAALAAAAFACAVSPAAAFDQAQEFRNYSKIAERPAEFNAPGYQLNLLPQGAQTLLDAITTQAGDPERLFLTDLCFSNGLACAGDIRLNDWQTGGDGKVEPVLFTARNGATISGHVWRTRTGPKKRPGVVITNGSVQAPEQAYWWAAQTLAKAGYVVMTWDPQNQGRSDTFGQGEDAASGALSQLNGETFYDGTQDALDFFLSTKRVAFCPRASQTGTYHCTKQVRRVQGGLNSAYNPFGRWVDPEHLGLAGHSFGASGVSYESQVDKRVDAVVAWDNLCDATSTCAKGFKPARKLRTPALGFSNDYGLLPLPRSKDPDPLGRSQASMAFSKAGVDTGEINIRGGTHYEYSYIPMLPFGATLHGIDMASWYTTAWFDKYLQGQKSADRRLLTRRWQNDTRTAAFDPGGDGNLYSYGLRSRLDIKLQGGGRFHCEDLRTGCPKMKRKDGRGPAYSYLAVATRPEG
ncbi:MAG: hypothetical protein QOG62_644 [Thermoleophilaceae bacterium]|jgi:dienelactone hydrolase|nr:hypothetical protein [Thermoleophilaceae bacterium]